LGLMPIADDVAVVWFSLRELYAATELVKKSRGVRMRDELVYPCTGALWSALLRRLTH